MKSFILLLLPLITGAQTSTVRGFQRGWLEFTCNYPKRNQKYDTIKVDNVKGAFRSFNTWENISNLLLYHDTENKSVTVGIKQPLQLHNSEYKITFGKEKRPKKDKEKDNDDDDDDDDDDHQSENKKERKVEVSAECCLREPARVQTAAVAMVTCDLPKQRMRTELSFCKDNSFTCEEILSTESSENRNGPFILKKTNGGFSIFISHASSRDNGVYWCAEKTQLHRAGFQMISIAIEEERSSTEASTRPTSTAPLSRGVSSQRPVVVIVVVCGCALVLTVVLICKWRSCSGLKKKQTKNENNEEERAYEEIQERPQAAESTTAIRGIYVTAGFPSNPPTEGPVGGAC